MRQDGHWLENYNEMVTLIESNNWNPSKHSVSSLL